MVEKRLVGGHDTQQSKAFGNTRERCASAMLASKETAHAVEALAKEIYDAKRQQKKEKAIIKKDVPAGAKEGDETYYSPWQPKKAKLTATERVFKLAQFTTAKKSNKENESLAQQ